jgi:oxygen-dependent protoporphyrinogen oxidase
MIGGRQRDDLANASKEALIDLATKDLDTLLGAKGLPCFSHLTTWPRAIPQYTQAFGPWKQTLAELEADNPNLAFGGHAIDGIAMGASIQSGKRLADETV